MSTLNLIMVATDFSERSDRALRRATLLARQYGSRLLLVHAIDDDQPERIVRSERDQAAGLLDDMASSLRETDGLECESHVILAAPFRGVLEVVRDAAPDLLLIGPHRRRMLSDVFVGTTAERILRAVDRPVLMANALATGGYRHVLQTTDLSPASLQALARFRALGLGGRSRDTLLHIFDATGLRLGAAHSLQAEDRADYLAGERSKARTALAAFARDLGQADVELEVRHAENAAPYEILKAAEEEQADLIVLSTHGRSGIARFFMGSVTQRVMAISQFDVLAVPPVREAVGGVPVPD